ncbi:centromere protein S [Callorhinchus milii]|uniref:centromere protein S n=1 Tax=Callorhinchus milii TaxID=7868 RepID=UPI0004572D25|nr:centromere protein S [Callorhinchus milii]|eukprot:gi/632968110/ref/XP_007900348.1/ PREDICTED: centromere protein S [Callorhinchus milii]
MAAAAERDRAAHTQRLRAAVHYTVGCLCQEVGEDKGKEFNKQTIAAIAETTFRQCEIFAQDLELFSRHGKRSTVNTEDVKLLSRRSTALQKFITKKCDDLASDNVEKKTLFTAGKGKKKSNVQTESTVTESDDTCME